MFSKDQYDQILYSLPSFYQDFLPVDNNLLKLVQVYAKTINYVWELMNEAEDSSHITTTRTLSTIPYFKINIDDAMYDLTTARVLSRMSFEEQIQYMDKEQKYASLVFNYKDNAPEPMVYAMRLFVNFSDKQPLRLYEDYFLRSNRLYLLPNYVQKRKQSVHYLHAFDIKYNEYTLEKNFGTRFSIQAGPLLPRFEYRDVLEAFMRVFQGDMTIKSIREGIQLATKWEQFKLEDYKSPTISGRKKQLYKEWVISPFKFIVSLPEELIPDKIKVNIVRTLLNEVKESQTDFMIFYDIIRHDPYRVPMWRFPTIYYNRGDQLQPEMKASISKVKMTFREFPLDLYGRYDTAFFYNLNLQYDDPPANEIVSIKTYPKNVKDGAKTEERVYIKHYKLVIPRQFKATKVPETGAIRFSTAPNKDTATHFELHGSATPEGPYELVETIANNPNAPIISFTHNANGSGKLYYKSRSKVLNTYSLFTLPIDTTAL
ncbi:hypothetical protein AAXE64_27520 [Priestia megaterium]